MRRSFTHPTDLTCWKLNPKVSNHESSALHNQNFCKWKELETRLQKGQTIDKKEQKVVASKTKKCHEILTRMFDITKFLAKQHLALRGHREDDTSTNRSNRIGAYDPILREHLVRIKMGQKTSLTYMSPDIQNEILGNKVRQEITAQVKKGKYYSMIFDSTPDNQELRVVESFIDFIETKSKNAEGISEMILIGSTL
ncbi:hypothetical protein ILUMI_09453 [Ignelater luminosus]|uniref:DUF4371 domain-containing protein n=1 Tax=Ignelater luminosus TaxID=2038154 RepID=A0A8K0CZY7_IGNLU|nr:hypothetical protein ILUMI_09453 [Ignelater luminosus]